MLKRKIANFTVFSLIFILILNGCMNAKLPWRSGSLVAQLYRQYKQELLLAYSNLESGMCVDEQHGYARGYFDNYRKQMIFQKERALDYMIDGRQFTTATDELSGYISEILVNDKYQIGVEILDPRADILGEGQFWGTKSRVIDLNTKRDVTVEGLLFNENFLAADYFYGLTFSKSDRELEEDAVPGSEPMDFYLDIIDLRTMQHQKIDVTENEIGLLYRIGNQVYGQAEAQKTAFLFDEMQMIEQKDRYNEKLTISKGYGPILKDVAPLHSNEHWYINPIKEYDIIKQTNLLQITENEINTVLIDFKRDDIIQIIDTANYGPEHVAILYQTQVQGTEDTEEFIAVYDLHGNLVEVKDLTELYRGDIGRLTHLDYVA